jgi:uncharacterized damage-inducible protein DinB
MISPNYVRQMAPYSAWQNDNQYAAVSGLSETERRHNRGAFFDPIQATLNHLIWADMMWKSRIAGTAMPVQVGVPESVTRFEDWPTLTSERLWYDKVIIFWAAGVSDSDLVGELTFFSSAVGCELKKPSRTCITHMFDHQTHHGGQVHAMLTAAGAKPGDTDLALMTVV